MRPTNRTVLFLCTGNYYRSRFAEIVFNLLAAERRLDWRADSRALNIDLGRQVNVGAISPHVRQAMAERRLALPDDLRHPQALTAEDLDAADLVIAMKEAEHRTMLAAKFAGWEDRVEYWHVHDLDAATPAHALREIEANVGRLVDRLTGYAPGCQSAIIPAHERCEQDTRGGGDGQQVGLGRDAQRR